MLEQIKEELYTLHMELPRYNLVAWTGGNVSARDAQSGLVVIKPSGVRYEHLRPEHMVVVDLEGRTVEGRLKPSSDTASHLYIYKQRPGGGGGSRPLPPYGAGLPALGRGMPVVRAGMSGEFGGPIPCGGFWLTGDETVGKLVVDSLGNLP